MAGGAGTRLRPYTTTLPKPLVPVGEQAIMEIVLRQLRAAGVRRVTIAVSHLAHLIMAYFGDGGQWGLEIDYSREDRPLSTIGPLKLIDDLPENFFVLNGDILTDLDYRELYDHHLATDADITVSTFDRDARIDFGVLRGDDGRIVGFEEKPTYHFRVSMGVYVLNRRLLEIVPAGQPFGFDDLMLACVAGGRNARQRRHEGLWLDIGRPDDYDEANARIGELLPRLLPEGGEA
jgi:NDP-sugar pyrophosphorylase family protein